MRSIIVFFILNNLLSTVSYTQTIVQKAHLAAPWYPTKKLENALEQLDKEAKEHYNAHASSIRALIAPHAGIAYSGAVAAATYRLINRQTEQILILAPDHSGTVNGIALPAFEQYQLPNGTLNVDSITIKSLAQQPSFQTNNDVFKKEHSLEMHLIFIQKYAPQARIIPLLVGSLNCTQAETIAKILMKVVDPHCLVCISSDFIHYGPRFSFTPFKDHQQLRTRHLNSQALDAIQAGSCQAFEAYLQNTSATICGANPIKILLQLIKQNFFGSVQTRLVGYQTSNNSDHENSVSYIGLVFTNELLQNTPVYQKLTQQEQRNLLIQARDTLNHLFDATYDESLYYPLRSFGVQQPLGAFTTLNTASKQLRGCIGRITSSDPLYKTVATVTHDTALRDTRFKPVTRDEAKSLHIKLSILSQPKPIKDYRNIQLGTHGIILTHHSSSAVFLPEVPIEFGWNLEQTLTQLAKKAGLPETAWKDPKSHFQIFSSLDIAEQ